MRRPLIALVLCCWTVAAQSRGYPAYERANKLFTAGRYQESFDAVEEALKLDPKLAPALTLKAKLALSANRFDVARQSLELAIAAEPKSPYAHFLLGFALHLQNEMPPALKELELARQLDPNDPRAALYLGLTHESLGNTDAAVRFYAESVRLENARGKPEADTLLTYARLLLILGRLEECGGLIDRALKLNPNSRDAHYERARLLLARGDALGAAKEAEQALRLRAGGIADRQIHYLLVRAYGLAGQEELAAKHAAVLRGSGR